MNRPAGIPIIIWLGAIAVGIGGFVWFKRKSGGSSTASPATGSKTGQPAFSQAQEVQDFQVFSALTSAQQGSDLNFLSEVAGFLGGGSSTGTTSVPTSTGGTGAGVPAPAPTGTAPPATVPASAVAAPASPNPASLPGYGAGLNQLQANNPNLAAATGGYPVTYNGVPI